MLLFCFCGIQYVHVPFLTSFQYIFFFLKIVIEGIRGQSYKGDIAIDDLWIDESPCPPEGHFYFSLYFCIISFHFWFRKKGKVKVGISTVVLTVILYTQEVATLSKKVSAPGSMYPTQTDQWVWMILIGHWEAVQHRVGKQDHQVTIQLEQPLVSPLVLAVWKCHFSSSGC